MKSDVFNTEINYIKDKRLRDNLVIILNMLPDYFYEVPASSTGKYHPSFSLGEGGLVRHSKVATRIGYTLLNNDSMFSSLVLHNIWYPSTNAFKIVVSLNILLFGHCSRDPFVLNQQFHIAILSDLLYIALLV